MTHTEFKNQVDALMNLLFGAGVANHSTIIEQINYLVFLRSLARKDERAIQIDDKAERVFSGDLAKYRWENLLMLNAEALFNLLEEIYKRLPELAKDATIQLLYRDAHVKVYDKPTLRRLVHEIEKMMSGLEQEAKHGHTDIYGDMYEYLLSKLSQAGTLGSFRTPRHIVKFMVEVIDPAKGETILDPACGTAGFLVAALEHLKNKYTSADYVKEGKFPMDKLDPRERKFIFQHALTGFDSDFDMFKFGLMNLYLHQLEHPQIKRQNTLVDTAGDRTKWDVILANPPFAGALDKDSISEDLRMGTRSTEILFLRYMIEHLSPNGRAGVIVPEGVVFSGSNAHKKIRQMLLEDGGLWAVVSLPAGVFSPYAGVKTSIVFFDKSLNKQIKEILFVKVENDGFDLGATKRPIEKNDLPQALDILEKYHQALVAKRGIDIKDKTIAILVSREKIAESGDFNLSGDRYKTSEIKGDEKWPMVELGAVIEILDNKRKPITKSDRKSGPFPYYGATGILDYVHEYLFDERLVLIGEDGAKWESGDKTAFIAEGKYWVNNHAHVVRPIKNKIIDTFIVAILNHMDFSPFITGVTVPKLNQEKLKQIKIPFPPLEVQKQIVEEIERYQKIIDGAKLVMENWRPRIEVNPEWGSETLGTLLERVSEQVDPRNTKGKVFYVGLENIESGSGAIVGDPIARYEDIKSFKNMFKKGDILYGKLRPNLNKVWLADRDGICSTDILVFRGTERAIASFYWYLMLSTEYVEKVMAGLKGAQLPRVGYEYLKNIVFPLPPLEIQKKIIEKIEAERVLVESAKKLIEIYEQKIQDKVAGVWGE
jgi:type I restriction enzyme M protein